MKTIDADKLIENIISSWDWETVDGITSTTVLKQIIVDIRNQPKVETTVSGSWEFTEFSESLMYGGTLTRRGFRCSSCKTFFGRKHGQTNFCPECGAKMQKENEE